MTILRRLFGYSAIAFLSAMFFLNASSCSTTATANEPPPSGIIAGRVVDGDTGTPLGATNISTQPGTGSVLTDSTGQYTIENVQTGAYTITATRSGYPVASVTITVNAGTRTRADIALFRRGVQSSSNVGNIEGRILDAETFRPISQASISTLPPTNVILTDSLGRFSLNAIAAGNYTINAARNGYASGNAAVAVLAGQTARADIVLTRLASSGGTGTFPPSVLPPQPRVSLFASGFSGPAGLAFDVQGNLYVANNRSGTISRVSPNGSSVIFASGLRDVSGLAFDAQGNLFASSVAAAARNGGFVSRITPNGTVSTFATNLTNPVDVKFDRAGNLYISDRNASGVTRILTNGTRTSFVSNIEIPYGLSFDALGTLYLSTTDGSSGVSIFRISPSGATSTFSNSVRTPSGLACDANNIVYAASFLDNSVIRINPDGSTNIIAANIPNPVSLAFDGAGNLYVSSYNNNVVYRISP